MPLTIQTRDAVIFRELNAFGFLSVTQVARLVFNGNAETSRKRLRKLASAGFLKLKKLPFSDTTVVQLTEFSATAMRQLGFGTTRDKLPSFILHDLRIRDVVIECRMAFVNQAAIHLIRWEVLRSPLLHFWRKSKTIPDGLLLFQNAVGGEYSFLLEVDCGTEPHGRLISKLVDYRRHRLTALKGDSVNRIQVIFVFNSGARAKRFKNALGKIKAETWVIVLIASELPDLWHQIRSIVTHRNNGFGS